jgi:hypothetical protein
MCTIGPIAMALMAVAGAPAFAETQRVAPESVVAMKQSFAPVVKRAAPAVINVYVSRKVKQIVSPFADDPFFSRLFGDNFGIPRERMENSLGSGVLVSPDGLAVTNNHVIQGSGEAEITVALSDGREFPAKVILKDERTDLVVLRLAAAGVRFPSIEFSDSDSLEVGDLVLAIGDPFGVGQTVTSGIVSALARTQVGISDYQFFIQTDAAINPGNSRRCARRYGRASGGHQHRHLLAKRRVARNRICDSLQYGAARGPGGFARRHRAAALVRRFAATRHSRCCRVARARPPRWRAGQGPECQGPSRQRRAESRRRGGERRRQACPGP